jgi:hypothetical protein
VKSEGGYVYKLRVAYFMYCGFLWKLITYRVLILI